MIAASTVRAEYDYCQQSKIETLLFVDITTKPDSEDFQRFLTGVDLVIAKLAPGQRLGVVTIPAAYTLSRGIFSRCKPGCLDAGILSSCNAARATRDGRMFRQKLVESLQILKSSQGGTNSDIVRSLREWTQRAVSGRRIIIYSDMLENSDLVTWTSKDYALRLAQFLTSPRAASYCGQIGGNSVHIYGFGRGHDPTRGQLPPDQLDSISRSWQAYFRKCGAKDVTIANVLDLQ